MPVASVAYKLDQPLVLRTIAMHVGSVSCKLGQCVAHRISVSNVSWPDRGVAQWICSVQVGSVFRRQSTSDRFLSFRSSSFKFDQLRARWDIDSHVGYVGYRLDQFLVVMAIGCTSDQFPAHRICFPLISRIKLDQFLVV